MKISKHFGYLIPILYGLLGVIATALFMYFVTLDLRFMAVISVIIFFRLALNLGQKGYRSFRSILLMAISPIFFFYFILAEIPGLYFIIPVIVASIIIGYVLFKIKVIWQVVTIVILSLCVIYCFVRIPVIVQNQLVKEVNQPAPTFSFNTLNGEMITNETLKGEVIVLDFFGTWCKPCIQELKDFKKISEQLARVKFYVISTDQQGDSIEKVQKFISKWKFDYAFGYDYGGTIHQSFGFTGVPALVIIDKSGNIRMKHEGYNASENLSVLIAERLEELINEK